MLSVLCVSFVFFLLLDVHMSLQYPDGTMLACLVGVYYVYEGKLRLMTLQHVQALQLDFGDVVRIDCDTLGKMPMGEPLPQPAEDFARQVELAKEGKNSQQECSYPDTTVLTCGEGDYLVFGGKLRRMDNAYLTALNINPSRIIHINCDKINVEPIGEILPLPPDDFIALHPGLIRFRGGFADEPYCSTYNKQNFSACDRVSIGAFIHNADIFVGNGINTNGIPNLAKKTVSATDYSLLVGRNQTVIFVETPSVPIFISKILPHVDGLFVVVSGNSDLPLPGPHMDALIQALRMPRMIHWYAMNCDKLVMPGKFSCLPLGMVHFGAGVQRLQYMYEEHVGLIGGREQNFLALANKTNAKDTIFSGFALQNNPGERSLCHKHFCGSSSPLRNYSRCHGIIVPDALQDTRMNHLQYYRIMANSRFVASPPGLGVDCYRTYETLWLGSYPIVKTSSLDSLYKDLPVLIVNAWEEVTLDLLNETFYSFQKQNFDFSSLYMFYWNEKFRRHFRH